MNKWIMLLLAVVLGAPGGPLLAADEEAEPDGQQIYRIVGADGTVVFTDKPGPTQRSEAVRLAPTNSVGAPPASRRPARPSAAVTDQRQTGYRGLSIASPEAGSTIRNPQEPITVVPALSPQLREGDRLVLFDNGVAQDGLRVNNTTPGVHALQLKVLSREGEELISSEQIEIYLHRATVNNRSQARPSDGGSAVVGEPARRGETSRRRTGGTVSPGAPAGGGSPAGRASPLSPAR